MPPLTDAVREHHLRIIHNALAHYADTLRKHGADGTVQVSRPHVLLKGKPAGAKTSLFERLKVWLDATSEVERVTFVDMPAATKAGMENWLLDRAELGNLAEVIVLEEIEKVRPLENLLPLVSLMGSGYVSKLNAVVGRRRQIANVLVLATCNDEKILRGFRSGVLWSRFALKLHCPRPSRPLMERILLDTVAETGGNPEWVRAVMRFAYETVPTVSRGPMDDPRELKGLLSGGDRLLDGSYQADLLEVLKAEAKEQAEDRHARLAHFWEEPCG